MKVEREIVIGAARETVWAFLWVEFPLEIEVLEAEAPTHLRARAGGRDRRVDGLVRVEVDLALAEQAGAPALRVAADIAVLGKLGTLGHSVIVRKGQEIVERFGAAVRAALEGRG